MLAADVESFAVRKRIRYGIIVHMARKSKANIRRSWKMERASVRRRGAKSARSNKFSGGDVSGPPRKHSRKRIWVGGYRRRDGVKVEGYYRANAQYRSS